ALLGVWIYTGVRNALIELAAANLRSLVSSQATTTETWIVEKRLNVQRWASDPRIVVAAERLLDEAGGAGAAAAAACRGPRGANLIATVDVLRQEELAAAVHLIDRNGRVLAARDALKCGHVLDAQRRAVFDPVFAGTTRFTGSLDEVERIGVASGARRDAPKVWIAAPVRDARGAVIAVLDIGKPANERFSKLFEAARLGETGELYAFDSRGRLLSESRFRSTLEDMGLVRRGESSILRVELNDPNAASGGPRHTRLIAAALAAVERPDGPRAGELLQPYDDYLGKPVVGAWRWLDEFGFGIAVEVAEAEALAPLLRLERVFMLLGLGIGIAVFGLVVALLRIRRMEIETQEAKRVGNYELLEEVGHGGMARVYRARHRLLKRPTAVKIIELAIADDEALARFDREVRLASQLMHPNTIEIYDYGRTPEGQPFYAMEFLDGLTLQQIVETHGPMQAARAAHVLRGIAGSLSEAHERGLIHRDIKPANVMLCRRGGEHDVVKVLDFGLVKDTRTEATRDLTRALRVLGTPAYMAPERIEHPEVAGHRADLYALGAVGFFLLAGRPPFDTDSDLALAYQVVHTPAPRVSSVAPMPVPPSLEALIARCLEKSPERRPPSATAVIEALDALLAQTPWTNVAARRWWDAHRDLPPAAVLTH
ncbi:MAG: serine/threonine protein kinase, partial [Burkholderiaceae bacterium]|nr:serine/threonine protein kinase [Burkholderiaceae bacterium]